MIYTEKELNQFLHGISLSLLSKKSAQHWRYDEETAREIEWLEALERKVRADKADRKTEQKKWETPPKFEHKGIITTCVSVPLALIKDEPQTVETMSCQECKHFNENAVMYLDQCEFCFKECHYEPKDEPQTETEIAKAIVHKMIDDAVIAEDAYPDLRQKMHDAVDEYDPQTERSE